MENETRIQLRLNRVIEKVAKYDVVVLLDSGLIFINYNGRLKSFHDKEFAVVWLEGFLEGKVG